MLRQEAAQQYSACPSKGQYGYLGSFRSLGSLLFLPYEGQKVRPTAPQKTILVSHPHSACATAQVKEFDDLVFAPDTEIGKIYSVRSSFGTHLVKVEGRGGS